MLSSITWPYIQNPMKRKTKRIPWMNMTLEPVNLIILWKCLSSYSCVRKAMLRNFLSISSYIFVS